MSIESMMREVQHFGVADALRSRTLRLANQAFTFRILKVMAIEQADPEFSRIDARYEHGFLGADALRRFARDPRYDLEPAQLEAALAKGDRCYGIVDGDTLASFGWYSTKPTAITDELVFRFDPFHVYMYKGFTHHAHRGKRLHAIGMTLALRRLREEGFAGIVSYVDATNLGSLKSCYRMGYRDVGALYLTKLGSRWLVCTSGGCARYGVGVEPARGRPAPIAVDLGPAPPPTTQAGKRLAVEAR